MRTGNGAASEGHTVVPPLRYSKSQPRVYDEHSSITMGDFRCWIRYVPTDGQASESPYALDVITFHHYWPAESLERLIASHKVYGRPLICTEWMVHSCGSPVSTNRPVFAREKSVVSIGGWWLEDQYHLPVAGSAGDLDLRDSVYRGRARALAPRSVPGRWHAV